MKNEKGLQALALSKEQVDSVIALYSSGKINEAIEVIKALNESYPNVPLLFNVLGACYMKLKQTDAAEKMFATAIAIKPDYAEAHFNYGFALKDAGKTVLAVESYRKAIGLLPNYPVAHNNLGSALLELKQYVVAVEHFEWAVAYQPDFFEAHNNLGLANREINQIHSAIKNFKKAIAIKPSFSKAHINLGNAFGDLGQKDAAIKCFEQALTIESGNAQAHVSIGTVFKELGQVERAIKSFERAIAANPNYGLAYYNLTSMKQNTINKELASKMQSILSTSDLRQSDRINFCFALANVYEKLEKKNDFFKFLNEGNRLRKEELDSSLERYQGTMIVVKKIFNSMPPINKKLLSYETSTIRPIFIVGMPRCGSTLVEQILSSHQNVHGAGEIQSLRTILAPIIQDYVNNDPVFTPDMSSNNKNQKSNISDNDYLLIRQQYLDALSQLNAHEKIITDKSLLNFRFIGIILKAFPEAKIIHLKRDARAICWSIYKNNFPQQGIGFGNNMQDLAGYYSSYSEMMTFWHERFPNKIYDLNYENLTANQEEETKKLLEYCELDWDKNCLNFHTNKRAVKTASALQVRKKIYQGSSEAWKKYETHLEPLIKSLSSY